MIAHTLALIPQSDNIVPFPQKHQEWYTPARYIDAARQVLGVIDLDPASCAFANRTVKAKQYYTEQENGLSRDWRGTVWLNPPYGTTGIHDFKRGIHTGDSNIKLFICKLIYSYEVGDVSQAILLCRADPTAMWFQPLFDYPICNHRGNFYFYGQGHRKLKHQFGTCFVYFGSHESKFVEVFSQFGRVSKSIDTRCKAVTPLSLWEGM